MSARAAVLLVQLAASAAALQLAWRGAARGALHRTRPCLPPYLRASVLRCAENPDDCVVGATDQFDRVELCEPEEQAAEPTPAAAEDCFVGATDQFDRVELCEPEEQAAQPAPAAAEAKSATAKNAEIITKIFISDSGPTEFGIQVAGLTVVFVAFLAWSSASLNDEFWTTGF